MSSQNRLADFIDVQAHVTSTREDLLLSKFPPVMYHPSQIVCVDFSCDFIILLFVSSELGKADSHRNLQLFVTIGTIEKITCTKARTDKLVLSMQRSFSFQ